MERLNPNPSCFMGSHAPACGSLRQDQSMEFCRVSIGLFRLGEFGDNYADSPCVKRLVRKRCRQLHLVIDPRFHRQPHLTKIVVSSGAGARFVDPATPNRAAAGWTSNRDVHGESRSELIHLACHSRVIHHALPQLHHQIVCVALCEAERRLKHPRLVATNWVSRVQRGLGELARVDDRSIGTEKREGSLCAPCGSPTTYPRWLHPTSDGSLR